MQPPTQHVQATPFCPLMALLLNRWAIIVLQEPMGTVPWNIYDSYGLLVVGLLGFG